MADQLMMDSPEVRILRAKVIRVARGLTQAEVGDLTGLGKSRVNQIENGRLNPYQSELESLASALQWEGPPGELLEDVQAQIISTARAPVRRDTRGEPCAAA